MAQSTQTNYFLIKGRVINNNEGSWSFFKTGFFDTEKINVAIRNDGTFNKKVPIEGTQDLSFLDGLYIYAQPNDTIEINWDERNLEKSIEVKSPSLMRNRDFQLNLKIWKDFRQTEISLFQRLANEKDKEDIERFKWINDQFNQQLKLVISNSSMTTEKFVYQIYYKHINLLLHNKLLKTQRLVLDNKILSENDLKVINNFIPETFSYNALNNKIFYLSPIYRDFLFEYLRFSERLLTSGPITNSVIMRNSRGEVMSVPYTQTRFYNGKNDIQSFTPAWNDYYTGLIQINLIPIRDWFITKAIFNAFKVYKFDEVESVLIDFSSKCQTNVYRDTLNAFYSYIKRFKQGNTAPNFSLKDQNGKTISLNDFKGKVVYLNFWGVHCSASKTDMQNFYPRLLEKYKGKDVVFVNICVDENEANWEKAISEYKLNYDILGKDAVYVTIDSNEKVRTWKMAPSEYKLNWVDLLAEGGSDSQVCRDYNFFATPDYIIIDKQGKILEFNPARPYDEISIDAIIDKSLLEK